MQSAVEVTRGKCQSRDTRPRRATELWDVNHRGLVRVLTDRRLELDQYLLNEIGSAIWRLCDGNTSVAEIARFIKAGCDKPSPRITQIERDVFRFLDSARRQGIVTWPKDRGADILLIVPPAPGTYAREAVRTPEYSSPPLGLCYIAATLQGAGFRVAVLDLHQETGLPEDTVAACRELQPTVVGITASTPTYPNAVQVARFVKAWRGDCTTVLGGPHATGAPIECVQSGAFDFVCVGEGERPMLELTKALIREHGNPREVAGFVHSCGEGKMVKHAASPRLRNLDQLPYPARDLLRLDDYYQRGAIISSRGCPIGCDFCACTSIVGQTYRVHSIERVINEMQHMKDRYGCRHFDFHDDTFNLRPARVFDFCRELGNRKMDANWGCFCRAAQMTDEMAQAMAGAGCSVIQYGVESGNEAVLRSLNKQTTKNQIESAVSAAANAGIEQVVCGFIIGHAPDTAESIHDTINFGLRLRDLGATRLTLSLLTPYPGTRVYENRDRLGIKLLTKDWEQYTFSRVVIETNNLNRDQLRELYVEGLSRFLEASTR